MATANLTAYIWDTDIGKFLAVAKDVKAARKKIMDQLSPRDCARGQLAAAIAGEPKIVGKKSMAILAWHQ
jgi:hypothetical protein